MTTGQTTTPRKQGVKRVHDAAATQKRILDAAIGLLSNKGFTALGINALAAEAGVDKQLIYYHFGGLDGVVRKLGAQMELWLGAPLAPKPDEPYAAAIYRLLMEYGNALRGNPLVLRLLAWELVESSPVLDELDATRAAAMVSWVQNLRALTQPGAQDVDAPAVNAILLAGLHYLAMREKTVGSFAGMDLTTAESAQRIARAYQLIITKTHAPTQTTAAAPQKDQP